MKRLGVLLSIELKVRPEILSSSEKFEKLSIFLSSLQTFNVSAITRGSQWGIAFDG